jgi:hypothetical protein
VPTPRTERLQDACLLLGVLVALGYVASLLGSTEGHAVPQIVDLYLICQYARGFAEGHPFQYNAGDPPTTGSTSLLYTSFLALGHGLGARGEALVALAIASGILLYLASIWMAFRIARRLGGDRAAALAGALLALGGPTVWGYLYGSDVGVFMFLSLWLLDGLVRSWNDGTVWSWVLPAGLLALSRPEGLPIAVLLAIVASLRARRVHPLSLLPSLLGAAVLLLDKLVTGQWLPTSVAEKSLLDSYGLRDTLGVVSEYLLGLLRGVLLGLYPPDAALGFSKGWAPFYLPPLALLFVGIAAGRRSFSQSPLRPWLAIAGTVAVLGTANLYMGAHFNRYVMWTLPTLMVATALGVEDLASWASRGGAASDRTIFRGVAAVMLASGLLATIRFGSLYGELAGGVYRRDVAAARWIERAIQEGRLPRNALIADDVTSVEYLTGHRNLGLHGVTSPAFFGTRPAEREAGVFEALSRLQGDQRPGFLLTSRSSQEAYPSLRSLVVEPPLFETTSGSDEIVLFAMDPGLLGRNGLLSAGSRAATQGLHEVDRLNVCDARDEADHHYRFRSRIGDLSLYGTVRSDSVPGDGRLLDGGRPILGEESFRVRTEPGRDLVMVLRTSDEVDGNVLRAAGPLRLEIHFPEAAFDLTADERPVARVAFHPGPGWEEKVVPIPARFVTGTATTLRLSGHYASFNFWFFQ